MHPEMRSWSAIPERFYSDLHQKPFEQCLMCERDLLAEGTFYLIEKAITSFEVPAAEATIFEYAICLNCAEEYRKRLSSESRNNIDAFYAANIDFKSRAEKLKGKETEHWLQECLIHKERAGEKGEVQIYALCQGKQMCFGEFPYMIRSEAMDEMMELISAETLDELEQFRNNLTSGPPELKEILEKSGPRMLI